MKLSQLHEESIGDVVKRWTPQRMSDDEIIAWCKAHSPKFMANQKPIYRGTEDGLTGLLDTTQLKRGSANSPGYYNWWIDNHESWRKENYPKRSESIIASSSPDTAELFGNPYLIVPEDTARIGICPENDIWGSFSSVMKLTEDLNDFCHRLGDILVGGHPRNWDELKIRSMRTTIEDLEDPKNELFQNKGGMVWDFACEIVGLMKKFEHTNLFDLLEEMLDPNDNLFRTCYASSYTWQGDNEVWVSGKIMQLEIYELSDRLGDFFEID